MNRTKRLETNEQRLETNERTEIGNEGERTKVGFTLIGSSIYDFGLDGFHFMV
jgi:hypothetical protein